MANTSQLITKAQAEAFVKVEFAEQLFRAHSPKRSGSERRSPDLSPEGMDSAPRGSRFHLRGDPSREERARLQRELIAQQKKYVDLVMEQQRELEGGAVPRAAGLRFRGVRCKATKEDLVGSGRFSRSS